MGNFLADIIANPFDTIPLVNFFGTFVVSAGSLIKDSGLANLMVAKPSPHAAVIPVGSTAEAGVIANPYNVGLAVNPLTSLSPSVTFAGSSVEDNSVAVTNLKAVNLTVDIYGNFVLAFTPAKSFIDVFVVSVSPTVYTGIVFNLSTDILSLIKPFLELALDTTYEE